MFVSYILRRARGVLTVPTFVYVILPTICSPFVVAHGEDEAPDPAEGLDPKVVEVYTKYVPSSEMVSLRITYFPSCMSQSRPAPTQLPRRPAAKAVQNYPLPPSMGAHPRAHHARAVVAPSHTCSDADIHLEYEAASGPRVPRGRRPRSRARGFRATFDAEGHAQAQPALVRGSQALAVQTRGVLQGHRIPLA